MNTKFLGALLVLAGLSAVSICAKSKMSDFEFANKTDQSLMFKTTGSASVKIRKGEIFHADMSGDDCFKTFTVSTKDKSSSLTIRPSQNDCHKVMVSDDTSAHSIYNKFDIHMKNDRLVVNGTAFFNPFKN